MTPLPASLTVRAPLDTFTQVGQTAELQAIGNLADGKTVDLTTDSCTTYISSNTALAAVSADGLVTTITIPSTPATLTITVINEGVVGTRSFLLVLPDEISDDVDEDGMPNDWELRHDFDPTFAGDARQDADSDGLTNLEEFQRGTEPRDSDTDRDGLRDSDDEFPLIPETIPPTLVILSPQEGDTLVEGATITVETDAQDNVRVGRVDLIVDGEVQFTDRSVPFALSLQVPTDVVTLTLSAQAFDIAGNRSATETFTVNVIPDPLTMVTGTVVDLDGNSVDGATVTCLEMSAETRFDGFFSLFGVPTIFGDIRCTAKWTSPESKELTGRSAAVAPIPGALTDVGEIVLRSAKDSLYPRQKFPVGGHPFSVAIGDFNADGVIDIVTANRRSSDVSVLLGVGDGTFEAQRVFAVGDSPSSVATGDFNADGLIDIVTGNFGTISILLHQ